MSRIINIRPKGIYITIEFELDELKAIHSHIKKLLPFAHKLVQNDTDQKELDYIEKTLLVMLSQIIEEENQDGS